jgi:hypothetical protein
MIDPATPIPFEKKTNIESEASVALCQDVPYLRCLPLGDPLGDRFRLLAALGWGARRLLVPLGAAFLANSGTAVLANTGTAALANTGTAALANSGTAVFISAFSLILSGERALEAPAANRNKPMAAAF